jgi:hypothetical protein
MLGRSLKGQLDSLFDSGTWFYVVVAGVFLILIVWYIVATMFIPELKFW